jgi:hypothetical protein
MKCMGGMGGDPLPPHKKITLPLGAFKIFGGTLSSISAPLLVISTHNPDN